MTDAQRREKIRSTAAQAAALAEARKEIAKLKYGQREHRPPTAKDFSFGWGQTDWAEK